VSRGLVKEWGGVVVVGGGSGDVELGEEGAWEGSWGV